MSKAVPENSDTGGFEEAEAEGVSNVSNLFVSYQCKIVPLFIPDFLCYLLLPKRPKSKSVTTKSLDDWCNEGKEVVQPDSTRIRKSKLQLGKSVIGGEDQDIIPKRKPSTSKTKKKSNVHDSTVLSNESGMNKSLDTMGPSGREL